MSWDLYLRALLYLLLVLGLIVGCTWLVRLYGGARLPMRGARRVQALETLGLDPRRRLMLVRWDDQEHLLLLSAAGDVVVASRPVTAPRFADHLAGDKI